MSRQSKRLCTDVTSSYAVPNLSEGEDNLSPPFSHKAVNSQSRDQRHPRFYFGDGDVTFKVSPYLFKVHTAKLIATSEFFQDMFMVASPDESEQTEDGHIITLDGMETVWNMSVWLAKIYDDNEYFQILLDVSAIQVAGALYHLGNKYSHPPYCAQAKSLLFKIFPTELPDWTEGLSRISLSTAFEAIKVAKLDCPIILPAAYYVASAAPLEDIIKGTIDSSSPGRCVKLSPDDQITVLRGKHRRGQIRREHTFSLFQDVLRRGEYWPNGKCPNRRACSGWLRTVYLRLDECGFFGNDHDCFESFTKKAWDNIVKGLCDRCCNQAKDDIWIGLQEACNAIPDMFGLHSWLDVRQDQREIDDFHTV
ncbi:hypothetical protein NEOLEDRAFT_1179503 [Neolentinus lepideus HHB14362 ss-1]|uniref:BTB domain-containing protein n=1 Tax=Neolentinus lepideus HHB14362 ss-1 TaxID=1314782 RepID=A0A165RTT0_9AGAM|nr:hypothetical protein NEOLEDRAFT_1179503 [Neolentinus lepideus HHB14362 ss-1]